MDFFAEVLSEPIRSGSFVSLVACAEAEHAMCGSGTSRKFFEIPFAFVSGAGAIPTLPGRRIVDPQKGDPDAKLARR